ncbi:glyoxylate reductase/hydroxypyruvate reductase-like [Sitodiplosis mosellana]|uniref:glyoxylate reductase/hydroxypyruvate reductase-like n=1 Tax=Sitodiplosis mosellana TaxID=263140 RepID=UPI002444A7CF|nr:glyoxylate reductase/hydroxypyruvate reductase-like [Sitodiplosis mosellana]
MWGAIRTIMTDAQRRPTVLITNPKTPAAGIQLLREKCDVIICEGQPNSTREEILSKSAGVDGILWTHYHHLNAEALDRAGPQLKAISVSSAGLDHVDINEVKKRNIPLGYLPHISNDAVADFTVALTISAARRFHEAFLKIINNQWDRYNPQWMLGQDLKGSTVGIVGLGGIGQKIAKRLKAFEIGSILYTGHREKEEGKQLGATFVSFDDLLTRSDFVIVVCPLNNETRNLFNKAAFAKMKSTSVFINVSRGGVVVQDDLVEALKNGTIFSAGLDVMTPEPLPPDHILTKLPNCVLIPHLASATKKTRDEMAILAAQNILNGIEGKPLIYSAY